MSLTWVPRRLFGVSKQSAGASSRARKARSRLTLDFLEDRTLLSTSIPLNSLSWTPVGPAGITTNAKFGKFVGVPGPTSGRIAGVAGDPVDPNVLYIAAAGGGVWKSVNAGNTWKPLTDGQQFLAMGSIAVAPNNGQVIYAGTGEANYSGDSRNGGGILKSSDGGATWTLTGKAQFFREAVANIAVSPTDANTAYAAVNNGSVNALGGVSGIYKTTDGGVTWTDTTSTVPGGAGNEWSAVVVNPATPLTVYAAVGFAFGGSNNGVYKSTDGGNTWNPAGNFPSGPANGRIELAISATDPKEIAASVSDPATSGLKYLQLSNDAGATWSNLASVPNYLGGQGWYDNTVAIDPGDAKILYAAGVINYGTGTDGVVISRDGGVSWSDLSNDSTGATLHTDTHTTSFDAAGRLLIGTDGGIWRLNNSGAGSTVWANLNNNLQITQYTGAALDPTNADVVYGGAQDNGTSKFTDNLRWTMMQGGDGGFVAVDPSNPQTVYAEYFGISLTRSDDGGANWTNVTTGIGNDPSNFYVQFTIDPSNPSHLLYGTDRLYTTTTRGNNWTALFTPGSNGWTSGSTINWTTIAASDPKTVYSTTSDGSVFVSTDGGSNWTQRNVAGANDTFQQITVDPADAKHALIVRNAYNDSSNVGHVFETFDAGANWTDISGDLPDVPADSLAIDTRFGLNRIFVGTDTGVYETENGGAHWAPFKTGLPNAQVVSLELNTKLDVLMAATHGRGVFEISASDSISILPTPISPSPTEGKPLGAAPVQIARFNDAPILLAPGQYTATIDWGDTSGTDFGTIVNLGNGFYGIDGNHTYTLYGTYIVSVTVSGTNGHNGKTSFTLDVADAPLTAIPAVLSPVVGQAFVGSAGAFNDANPFSDAAQFSATIDWGDGKVTKGTVVPVVGVPNRYMVTGTNTYTNYGAFAIKVSVVDAGGSTVTINSTVNVQDAPITVTAKAFNGIEGTSFTATVASFVDGFAAFPASNFLVTVKWGDGTPDTTLANGASVVNRGTRFDVIASHTYARFGTYPVNVKVDSLGGSTNTAVSTATITDAPIGAVASNFTATEGVPFAGTVATVSDSNPFGVASDYTGSLINWGDGTPPTPATGVVNLGGGKFGVQGTHTYTSFGTYFVSVQVLSAGGSKANAQSTGTVQDTSLTARGVADLSAPAGQPVGGVVATFHVGYALAPITNYSATVDWGDGTTPAPGAITGAGGDYVVTAFHTYAKAQTYPVRVFVLSVGGSTDTATSRAVISDPPVIVTQIPLGSQFQGSPFGGTIATLSTGNSLASTADYIASIDWGDGKTTGGLLTSTGGGNFNISAAAQHAYDVPGGYTVTTTVISLGGNRGSASGPVTVAPAPILVTPGNSIQTVAGSTFSGPVATFKQFDKTPVSSFTATIDWGDGVKVPGVVTANADGTFTVSGSNLFKLNGPSTVTVDVSDTYGSSSSITVQASIDDAALQSTGTRVSTVFGRPFSGTVATFTSANPYALAGEFAAVINWGDGTPPTLGAVSGSAGSFTVNGAHTFAVPSKNTAVNVVITHTGLVPGTVTSTTTLARVLLPESGALSPASDSGPSNTDGVTKVTTPTFTGRGEPGSMIKVYAAANGGAESATPAGTGVADALGNWVVQISPLPAGVYTFTARMYDPFGGALVQTVGLLATPANGPLVIATTGPTVASVSLDRNTAKLRVVLQGGLGGLDGAALARSSNYSMALPVGLGLRTLSSRGLTVTPGPGPGQQTITLTFNNGKPLAAGGYVVTLSALGLTDLAGNMLRETNLVAFPQTTNTPNPNYIAQIDVPRAGAASAPHVYVSLAEQIAANNYSQNSQKNKIVRVPKGPTVKTVKRKG